jgi:uncharacterized protein (DUF58 family)
MRRIAGTGLTVSAVFLGIVAVLINAPALFYMSFALIATLGTCYIQSNLATKALRIERIAPKSVHVGELVTVEIIIWSERRIKRPLITILDSVPERLDKRLQKHSLPIAPAYDLPVRSLYQFVASRRGKFSWRRLTVTATDALGLTTKEASYLSEPTELVVIPAPIPVSVELPSSAGWGINEAISGRSSGAGIEPRGIRQYTYGDSLRHVHWRSSARSRTLQVKEFQAGSQGTAIMLLQRSAGSDFEGEERSSLDLMCGNALFIASQLIRQGVTVSFPNLDESVGTATGAEDEDAIAWGLGVLMASSSLSIGTDLMEAAQTAGTGSTFFVMAAREDGSLVPAIQAISSKHHVVVLAYDLNGFDLPPNVVSTAQSVEQYRQAGADVVIMNRVRA